MDSEIACSAEAQDGAECNQSFRSPHRGAMRWGVPLSPMFSALAPQPLFGVAWLVVQLDPNRLQWRGDGSGADKQAKAKGIA